MWRTQYIISFIVAVAIYSLGCSKKTSYTYISSAEDLSTIARLSQEPSVKAKCNDNMAYAPELDKPLLHKMRLVKVNVHFMYDDNGNHNFGKAEGKKFMRELIHNANTRLSKPHKMNLPEGNNTPVIKANMKYVITPATNDPDDDGFYFHNDSDLFYFINKGKNRNNYSRDVIKKYSIASDSILNIFVLPHHPDSAASKTYKPHGSGIALGTSLKMAGLYENDRKSWSYATLLNHEIGHIFGLRHAWTNNDGCDDTPKNPNCWGKSKKPPCNEGEASNNLMDYNNSQMAITPCQLGVVRKKMSDLKSKQRKLVVPSWCNLDATRDIIIDENTLWEGAKDLEHNIRVKSGAELKVCCRLGFPRDGSITVESGAKLILDNAYLHNDCNDTWLGIEIISSGSNAGIVEYIGDVKIENVLDPN